VVLESLKNDIDYLSLHSFRYEFPAHSLTILTLTLD
jgi:hypothetical protein